MRTHSQLATNSLAVSVPFDLVWISKCLQHEDMLWSFSLSDFARPLNEASSATFSAAEVIIACNHSGADMYRYSTSCKAGGVATGMIELQTEYIGVILGSYRDYIGVI